ncbi:MULTISPECIES: HAD family hydrolase [Salinibaculum]|uniref:HAD family hydrolase n=1 Tax=Salinibaculum TaxID=2732368 RepID=UPI0030D5DBB6
MAVSFDLFGTLVTADRPAEPWAAAATELRARGVGVPDDWEDAYRSSHVSVERGAELSLVTHTAEALASRGVDADDETVRDALLAAFDGPVTVRDGAPAALRAASEAGAVGLLSNCSLPGLVERTLDRASLPVAFDAVVTSVDCGWRKPHDRAFGAVADALGVPLADLVHVGDDPRADGGARTTEATVVLTEDVPLAEFPAWLEERWR